MSLYTGEKNMPYSEFYIIFDKEKIEFPEVFLKKPKLSELEDYEYLVTVIFDEVTRKVHDIIGVEHVGWNFEGQYLAIEYPLPPVVENALKSLTEN